VWQSLIYLKNEKQKKIKIEQMVFFPPCSGTRKEGNSSIKSPFLSFTLNCLQLVPLFLPCIKISGFFLPWLLGQNHEEIEIMKLPEAVKMALNLLLQPSLFTISTLIGSQQPSPC